MAITEEQMDEHITKAMDAVEASPGFNGSQEDALSFLSGVKSAIATWEQSITQDIEAGRG